MRIVAPSSASATQTAPEGVKVYNPAFDVTPAHLIAGLITEKGLIQPVNEAAIRGVIAPVSRRQSISG